MSEISLQEEDNIISAMLNDFNRNNMVLFIGNDVNASDLSEALCRLPWSCVVTSSRLDNLGGKFVNDVRRPMEYSNYKEMPAKIYDRVSLPIIRLFGGTEQDEVDDDIELARMMREQDATKMLQIVLAKLDILSQMIVVGYRPDVKDDIQVLQFLVSLKECQGGMIRFFQVGEGVQAERLKKYAQKNGYECYPLYLAEAMERENSENSVVKERLEVHVGIENIFYKNNNPVSISDDELLRYQDIAELLTEERIHEIRPLGRIQQNRWFYNFLTRSSANGPQWYGYLPQSDFHLKRDYEDILVNLVMYLLGSGKDIEGLGANVPVILEGAPGSGKSIALAALAYRVFQKHTNPVIFIRNSELNTAQDLDVLDNMMRMIQETGEDDARILVVWDSSAYYNVTRIAKDIATWLDNHGRKFLLVCSAYNQRFDNSKVVYFRQNQREYVRATKQRYDYLVSRNCRFIHASREMKEGELPALYQKIKLYTDKKEEEVSRNFKLLEAECENSIFEYFYRLINILQPELESGLRKEQKKIGAFVQTELDRIMNNKKEKKTISLMKQALMDAGIDLDSRELEEVEEEENRSMADLHRFNMCIAMFGRFKLNVPSNLALNMLFIGKRGEEHSLYSTENRELFRQLTTGIPWIMYRMGVDGDFHFVYRNTLEAEIFLKRHVVDTECQIDMICDMLDYYYNNYRINNYMVDIDVKNALQKILRMIGPNSDYIAFHGSDSVEHNNLLKHLPKIIDKLEWIRVEGKVPDTDASFASIEVTFLREYYSVLWEKFHGYNRALVGNYKPWEVNKEDFTESSYLERLNKLQKAENLALKCINELERLVVKSSAQTIDKRFWTVQMNSFAVEVTRCNMKLKDLWEEYSELCKFGQMKQLKEWDSLKTVDYITQFRRLNRAINSDPLNGYAYNALFSIFEREYERADEERKLQLLSEIQVIADDANMLELQNRGANGDDEIARHLNQIAQYNSAVRITIESIENHTCGEAFEKLFADMLSRNNPAAISFVCQQELQQAGLNKFSLYDEDGIIQDLPELDQEQLAVCSRICSFMKKDKYKECVERNPYALYLLLRVTWMYYTRRPLIANRECRLIKMNLEQWKEIRYICDAYEQSAGENKKPLAVLVHALAITQVEGDYIAANALLESMNESLFFTTPRMRVPFMICDENGVAKKFEGKVISIKEFRGFIAVNGVPLHMGSKTGVRFYMKNLGMDHMPKEKQFVNSLELGIGYTGFSAYTEKGRKRLEGKNL